jgi:hypothetical protein
MILKRVAIVSAVSVTALTGFNAWAQPAPTTQPEELPAIAKFTEQMTKIPGFITVYRDGGSLIQHPVSYDRKCHQGQVPFPGARFALTIASSAAFTTPSWLKSPSVQNAPFKP